MHGFQTTRWSLIETARGDPPHARDALESLCRAYRPPVLAYVRRSGYNQAEAEDLTQDFFVDFLRRGWYAQADPRNGRFRALLLVTLRRFLIDHHAQAGARKRGGGQHAVAVDPDTLPDQDNPERAFTRMWMQTVIEHATTQLQREWQRAGKGERFGQLAPLMLEGGDGDGLRQLAQATGERPNTLSAQCSRMRRRLRQLVRLELLRTVGSSQALERELAELRAALHHVGG